MAPKNSDTPYITGTCQLGLHEGEQIRNYREEPLAFCRGQWSTHLHGQHTHHKCGCACHALITEIMQLDKKSISRIIKGAETGMEHEFLAEMCATSTEVVARILRNPEWFSEIVWTPGERVWFTTGKWWRDDDKGVRPVEKYWHPWEDSTWRSTKSSLGSDEVTVVTAEQRDETLAEQGELTPNQMRVRRAITVGILPPNPDYVVTGRAAKREGVSHEQALARGLKQMGLTLREGVEVEDSEDTTKQGNTRVARQLEREVKEVCDMYTLGLMPDVIMLTTSEIAKAISVDNPPSTGAITNVLKRWHEVGFAVHETGPHRFGGYTAEGIQLGVNKLYARAGRDARGAATRALHTFHRR